MSPHLVILIRLIGPVLLSAALCALVMRFGIKDAPDGGRKTQAAPVPNAGGVAILLTTVLSCWIAARSGFMSDRWTADGAGLILAASMLAGVIGLVDDMFGMAAKVKLGLLLLVSGGLAAFGPQLQVPGLPALLAMTGVGLWILITINAVNFMDGSNGLALGSSAIMLLGAADILTAQPGTLWAFARDPDTAFVAGTAALAIFGFLAWNLPGRLYAGDSGALGIGALFGGVSTVVAQVTTVWTAAILFLPFLVDVMLTIFWRASRGRSVMTAHREHAYQLFLRAGWNHLPVAMIWWALSMGCWVAAAHTPDHLAPWVFQGLAVAGSGLWLVQRLTLGRRLIAEGR
ncbi:MAG: hypothetical protein R3C13_00725 [Hyphomonas sp.]|uniref:glycosyltransferase family 4 protein n=1 Tax=Hyphomonas sp. TaxID=87 RepID=UPI0035278AB6